MPSVTDFNESQKFEEIGDALDESDEMALTVGTDTYLSIADADTYWSDRNNAVWSAATDAEKEKALREATQFLDVAYTYIGTHPADDQVLAWPRDNVVIRKANFRAVDYDNVTIPPQIKNACAELALEALNARLRPAQERGGAIKRQKVDVVEVEYSDFAPSQKSYDFVTMILKPLLRGGIGKNQASLERS